jgi:hypothetical protein
MINKMALPINNLYNPRYIINTALKGIKRVRVHVHRLNLSGIYNDIQVDEYLGNQFKFNQADLQGLGDYSDYRIKAYCQLPEGRLTCYYYPPSKSYKPKCMMTTVSPSPALLYRVGESLPFLKVSSVEYAVDIFCDSPMAVQDLFYVFGRYLFVPRSKNVYRKGGPFHGYRESRSINAVLSYSFNSNGKYVKLYERGKDELKITKNPPSWRTKDIDRLRFELTIRRGCRKLQMHGIGELYNFALNPYCEDILFPEKAKNHEIQFKVFTKHHDLPQDHIDFTTKDKKGNMETFQLEYWDAKNKPISNLNNYVSEKKELDNLKERIRRSAKLFDLRWKNKINQLIGQ